MSANNFIKIDRRDFTVSDCDAETVAGILVDKAESLDEAINIVQKYQEENIVEYGIQFTGKRQDKLKVQQSKSMKKQ